MVKVHHIHPNAYTPVVTFILMWLSRQFSSHDVVINDYVRGRTAWLILVVSSQDKASTLATKFKS